MVIQEPDYGSGSRAVPLTEASPVKYIRITDFDDEGIPPGHEFVTASLVEECYRLEEDDLLFARSGATAGKTYIHNGKIGPAIFAGYCIRFRFDSKKVLPEFVYYYTKTNRYKLWVQSIQRPSGQPNINKEEFKAFTIPLPPIDVQRQLVAEVEKAHEIRNRKLQKADKLLSSLDEWLLEKLGLMQVPTDERMFFAVSAVEVRKSYRLNPDYFHPERMKVLRMLQKARKGITARKIDDVVEFHRDICEETTIQNYLGLANVERNSGELVQSKEHAEGQSFYYRENDVLFARLRPYLNKVYRAEREGVCSTEFHVMRVRSSAKVLPDYLAVILRSRLTLAQTRHMMTGNTHPRLANDDVINLIVPVPSEEVQRSIATDVRRRRKEARLLQGEAATEWDAAKRRFEQALLGKEA